MKKYFVVFITFFCNNQYLFSQDSVKNSGLQTIINRDTEKSRNQLYHQTNPFFGSKDPLQTKFLLSQSLRENKLNRIAYSSLDTCATYTFRLTIGNPNREEAINNITRIDSSSLLLSGKLKETASAYEAMLIKLNPSGTFIWGRTYSENNLQVELNESRSTFDGGIIATGSIHNTVSNEGWLLICKLDKNGNQEWTRRYKSPVAGVVRGADIIQLSDSSYLFIGDNTQSLIYGKLDGAGNLLWSNSTSPFPVNKSIRILEDYNGHFIIAGGEEGGFKTGTVFKVSLTDGAFIWGRKFGGASANSNFIFHKAEMVGLRPRITGIYAPAGQPYKLIRITVNTGSLIEYINEYTISGGNPDAATLSALDPDSEAICVTGSGLGNKVVLVKSHHDEIDIPWTRSYSTGSPVSLVALEKTFDGGFITGLNSNNDILLIKTDSIGLNPGCTTSNELCTKIITNPSIPSVIYAISPAVWQVSDLLLTENSKNISASYECKQLTCPPPSSEDTCLLSFYKTYRSYDFCELSTGISETKDDNIILSGINRTNAYEPATTASFIAKLSKKGNLLKKERWLMGNYLTFNHQIRLSDGNILIVGVVNETNDNGFALLKVDENMNIIWNKYYRVNQITNFYPADIVEGDNGSIFIFNLIQNFANLDDRVGVLKFDNNGNLLWEKNYRQATGISLMANGENLAAENGFLFVNTLLLNSNNKWTTILLKMDQANGNVVWAKNYVFNNSVDTRLSRSMSVRNGRVYLSGYIPFSLNNDNNAWLRVSPSGIPEKTKVEVLANANYAHDFLMNGQGEIISANPLTIYSPTVIQSDFYLKMDTGFNVLIGKKTPSLRFIFNYDKIQSTDGTFYTTGIVYQSNNYNAEIYLKRYQVNGEIGTCVSDTMEFPGQEFSLTTTDLSIIQTVTNTMQAHTLPLIRMPFSLQQNKLLCGSQLNCDTLILKGETKICDTLQSYTFFAQKNPGCTAGVSWSITGASVQILNRTDSSVVVRFLQAGQVKVKSTLFTGCREYKDSLTTVVQISPGVLNIGPDTVLCPGNTKLLNARRGFTSYIWQDGSTDSTYTVNAPGTYWVQTTNACNDLFRDTIIISAAPPIPFDLGADKIKCNADSLTIAAPAGFLNYSWSPSYNISSISAQSVIVFPDKDTVYYVRAEKSPGCFAYDTIAVKVNRSPLISLGSDTSFCAGGSVTLNAGTGFVNYLWSNGSANSSITASAPGLYFVTAKDLNNCISKDSLRIFNVYSLPTVQLPKDHAICTGTNEILSVNISNATYLWNTGATGSGISVNFPGLYYVVVTDSNGCKGSDSTIITGLLPLPAGFLPKDTVLCSYSELTVSSAVNYRQYLWNTGVINKSITVSQPGLYWLQVTDNNNCTNRDSIIISPRQCLEGFYIPTAFTPNNDGLNDNFKPLLFGNAVSYHFMIYTRWGQLIFETKDLNKGWNGQIAGRDIDSGVFVWQCYFQFANQKAEQRKGTVVLVR